MDKIPVLCTRPLGSELKAFAALRNIVIDELSFIETSTVETVEVQQEIENALLLNTTVIFTSMNAVEAVALFINIQPQWKIYCIGNTTKELVQRYFSIDSVAGTADNAGSLADLIILESEGEEVIFFCGDQRRHELPEKLRLHDIEVTEVVVYETITVLHKVQQHYFGILFFSPSAVESYFTINKPDDKTVLFAIGVTTADAIKKHSGNKVIISDWPGKQNLFEKMVRYFTGE